MLIAMAAKQLSHNKRRVLFTPSPLSPLLNHAEQPAPGEILTWAEVNRTHRIRGGIYHRRGQLISLLTDFGHINTCYPDRQTESGTTIYYTGEGRHGDQPLSPGNQALLAAINTGHAVPVFCKIAPSRWQHLGRWRATNGAHRFDEHAQRMLWRFTLERANDDE